MSTPTRQHPRYSPIHLYGSLAFSAEAEIINISVAGMAVRTNNALAIGKTYTFKLGAPGKEIQISGPVRWCRLRQTRRNKAGEIAAVFETGIVFDNVLSARMAELVHFLEDTVLLDLSRRIFGRFDLIETQTVEMEAGHDFVVRRLSLSGMMVESPIALQVNSEVSVIVKLTNRELHSPAIVRNVAGPLRSKESEEPVYQLGLEFSDMEPEEEGVLTEFVEKHLATQEEGPGEGKSGSGDEESAT